MKKKQVRTAPFDRRRIPPKQNPIVMPLLWIWCFICTRRGHLKIHKINMKGLKPPYIVFGNHNAFMDFYVTPLTIFPHRANYISELEGFEAYGEWKYRQVGCLGTRKFINDIDLVRNIKRVTDRGGIIVIYPEARYANVGTNSILPISTAKLCKLLKVPVVTLNMKGNYLQSPIWNLKKRRGVKLDATIKQIFSASDIKNTTVEEIQRIIQDELSYDEYEWQSKAGIKITESWRAEGLHLPLYKCPKCSGEFTIESKGVEISCSECGSRWILKEDGTLKGKIDNEEIRIPSWYEWQRKRTEEEIDNGEYLLDMKVHIEALPNAVNFIDLGEGRLHHDNSGFELTLKEYGESDYKVLKFPSHMCYSIHTEYDYRGKGQCVTLSALDNTYFIFPLEKGFNATKIQFATEYMYQRDRARIGKNAE